jgi:TonB family protein
VTKEGTVRDAVILKSSPAGVFDQAAIEAVHQYIFDPGTKGGEAVTYRIFNFDSQPIFILLIYTS